MRAHSSAGSGEPRTRLLGSHDELLLVFLVHNNIEYYNILETYEQYVCSQSATCLMKVFN